MPYRWTPATPDKPAELRLWPHRSLPRGGLVAFIAITASLMALPLLANLGAPSLWVILGFALAALAAVWAALNRNLRDRQILETLTLTADRITLTHQRRNAPALTWQANPFWLRVTLYPTDGPVPHYLTLAAEGREVELGRFLTPEERQALASDLHSALATAR